MFTLKSVFQEIGLFNKNSYTGSDEEWGKEVYAQGFKQVYAENVKIFHPAR
ncbi:MAG: hypothetical protein MK193_13270 [Lentisphaeria bacterium]|nr:hypothetical protein [Lentisphaeria bacterium]